MTDERSRTRMRYAAAARLLLLALGWGGAAGAVVHRAPPPPVYGDPGLAPATVADALLRQTRNESLHQATSQADSDPQTTWAEDAEGGAGNVVDGTDGGYALVQSEIVAEEEHAFHLANPDFNDNFFELDVPIEVLTNSKLFFLSRLRFATSSQVARVQVSTDGGVNWQGVYSQAGDWTSGEGSFHLREVDLGTTYAGQDVRIRFYYDFTGGSAATGTDSTVGWFVDDIQVGAEFDKSRWLIGAPTPTEVAYVEALNRARADALVEAARLRDTQEASVAAAYASFGIDRPDIVTQFAWHVTNGTIDQTAQPLAFNVVLVEAAQKHTQDMFKNAFQGHASSTNPPAPFDPGDTLSDRLDKLGYSGSSAENVFSYSQSVRYGHAAFDVDWGTFEDPNGTGYNPNFTGQGMQNPPGHRLTIHKGEFNEVGVGVINGSNGNVGPQVVTQDFGGASGASYITGVVYDDEDGGGIYSAQGDTNHEGRAGVRVDVDGIGYYAVTTESGAYAIPVGQDGTYTVTFSGIEIQEHTTSAVISGGQNTKLDHDPDDSPYAVWAGNAGVVGGPDEDDDGDGVENKVEYLIEDMDPTVPDGQKMYSLELQTSGDMHFTVQKRSGTSGLSLSVLVSVDLVSWHEPGDLAGTSVVADDANSLVLKGDASLDRLFYSVTAEP